MKFNNECWLVEHNVEKEKNEHWAEYVSLGIMNAVTHDGGLVSSSVTVYKITKFGEDFIKYITE
jgi:hypothetical protein